MLTVPLVTKRDVLLSQKSKMVVPNSNNVIKSENKVSAGGVNLNTTKNPAVEKPNQHVQ